MSEELPEIPLELAGKPFIANPHNAHLFTFSKYAKLEDGSPVTNPRKRNHVFLRTHEQDPESGVDTGTFVFEVDTVKRLGALMLGFDFPARLNQMTIPDCDERAYQTFDRQMMEYEAETAAETMPDEFNLDDWSSDGKE